MKRYLFVLPVVLLCLLLLLSGCTAKDKSELPKQLIDLFAGESAQAYAKLKPTEVSRTEHGYSYYKELVWFGEHLTTYIGFEDGSYGKITSTMAQKNISGDIAEYAEDIFEKASAELHSPVTFICLVNNKQISCDVPNDAIRKLNSEEVVTFAFTFQLPDTTFDDRKFLNCIFIRDDTAGVHIIRYCLSDSPQ